MIVLFVNTISIHGKLSHRLRSQCAELELSNTDISSQRNKLEEDRADVISFLNRTLSEKEDDILELKERLEGLQQVCYKLHKSFLFFFFVKMRDSCFPDS